MGKRYEPPFESSARVSETGTASGRVIAADFVTLDTGTGIVHIAPAFGEDDHDAHRKLLASAPGPAALLRREARRHVRAKASIATPAAG